MSHLHTTRRQFIKNASQVAGGSFLLPSLSWATPIFQKRKQEKSGFALVGLGNYSEKMLGPALKETNLSYLSGLVTGTPAKAETWSKEYNVPEKNIYSYDNFDEIANNDDIDIVYIVLPNSMHAEYSIRALEAGKHVICEKPMAMNAAEAWQMIETARKVKRKLAIGYRLHYDPYHREVMRLGQNEVFGPINFMECSLGYSSTPQAGSWKLKKDMGGGALYNLAVYPIQGARYTKGQEPVYVTAQASTKRKEIFTEVDEIVSWQLEFADGTLCNSYVGSSAYVDRLYAGCTDGFMELQPSYNYTGQAGRTAKETFNFEHVFQQKLQIDDFARCVLEDKESKVKGEEGWRDMLVVDAIHQAIERGERMPLNA
ncbi:MAG: Gfo/Idh/MocA family oxidoreductase [Bacteroidia bacterium]|nr:Gfo/Idh/MocA family oxidoreductase [Bacteroidia bacterium]